MALLKVADFRTSQDGQSGYVLFKLVQLDGSVSNWIGWQYVPIAALASLQNILNTGNAYYDTETKVFITGSVGPRALGDESEEISLNPEGIESPIESTKKIARKVSTRTVKDRNSKNKKK